MWLFLSAPCALILRELLKLFLRLYKILPNPRRYRGLRKRNALQLLAQRTGIEGDLFFFNAVGKEKIEFGIAGDQKMDNGRDVPEGDHIDMRGKTQP